MASRDGAGAGEGGAGAGATRASSRSAGAGGVTGAAGFGAAGDSLGGEIRADGSPGAGACRATRRSQGLGARSLVLPVLRAFRAEMKMRSASGSRRRRRARGRKAPRTTSDWALPTHALVVPVALADVAVVRMGTLDRRALLAHQLL